MYVHRFCGEHYTAWVKEGMTDNSLNKITMEIENCWIPYAYLRGWGCCKNRWSERLTVKWNVCVRRWFMVENFVTNPINSFYSYKIIFL